MYAWVPEIVFELLHKQQNANDVILCKDLKHIVYGVVLQNLVILRQAVPVSFDQVVFYKMADYWRPEVAGDVNSGQIASGVEVVPLTKFGDTACPEYQVLQTTDNRKGHDNNLSCAL